MGIVVGVKNLPSNSWNKTGFFLFLCEVLLLSPRPLRNGQVEHLAVPFMWSCPSCPLLYAISTDECDTLRRLVECTMIIIITNTTVRSWCTNSPFVFNSHVYKPVSCIDCSRHGAVYWAYALFGCSYSCCPSLITFSAYTLSLHCHGHRCVHSTLSTFQVYEKHVLGEEL